MGEGGWLIICKMEIRERVCRYLEEEVFAILLELNGNGIIGEHDILFFFERFRSRGRFRDDGVYSFEKVLLAFVLFAEEEKLVDDLF